MKGADKPKEHTETQLICFDIHRGFSQSEENKCMRTHLFYFD